MASTATSVAHSVSRDTLTTTATNHLLETLPTVLSTSAQDRIAGSLTYLTGLESVFYSSGFILAVLGFMAWQMNKINSYQRGWGKRLCATGVLFIIIGSNYGGFMRLLYYVVGQ